MCTEHWAERHRHPGSDRRPRRIVRQEPTYQWWLPLDRNRARSELTLTVVREAPLSHVGSALSFLWTATARDRRPGFDHLDRHDLEVLP